MTVEGTRQSYETMPTEVFDTPEQPCATGSMHPS